MNTTQKLLVSTAVNAGVACFIGEYQKIKMFLLSSIFPTLSIYINQNITDSKPIQYTMTAIEILPALCLFEALYEEYDDFSMRFVNFYKELLSPNTGPDEKKITAVVTALSFVHKYIWDQPDDSTVELDQDSNVNGIKMEAVIHSFDTL